LISGIEQNTGLYTHNNDTVYTYGPIRSYYTPTLNDQIKNNTRELVGATLNIPLFNGWQNQYVVRQAKINLETQELALYQAQLTLKQNVYKAHNDALNAIQKYNATLRAQEAAARALDFAKKRYDLGLTNTVDFLVTQNQNYTAVYNLLSAKYDLIFKLKVIDYYLGKALKL
jgi:outer membrane protein